MKNGRRRKISSFPPHFQRTTETPNKKKKKMNEQVFVTTSDAKTIKAISVDLETFVVSDVLSSLMGDSDDGRNLEGINLRSTRTGQMFQFHFPTRTTTIIFNRRRLYHRCAN